MKTDTIEIECKTKGFEEAQETVEALVDAYDGLPSQVQIKNCRDCTINVYPSQVVSIKNKRSINGDK